MAMTIVFILNFGLRRAQARKVAAPAGLAMEKSAAAARHPQGGFKNA
jgi:hypothetical protein